MADPTSFEWSLLDRVGNVARTQAYVAYDGATETVDALIGSWLATGALLDAATHSKITGGQITIPLERDGSWKAAPASTGNLNGSTIVVDFANAANQYATPILLPAFLDAMIANGKVLLTQTQLAALTANLLLVSGTSFYNSRDMQQLTAVRDAFLADRKQRGQRTRTRSLG